MATAIKKCRVCGKEYPACRNLRRGDGVFRWQEVACSPECAAEYLRQINISRGVEVESPVEEAPVQAPKKRTRRKTAKEADPIADATKE